MLFRLVLCMSLFPASAVFAQEYPAASPPNAAGDTQVTQQPAPQAKRAEPSLEELDRRMEAAHAQTLAPTPRTDLSAPQHAAARGGIRFVSIFGAGLVVSGGMMALSFLSQPVAIVILPLSPFATAAAVTLLGNRMGGQGRYPPALGVGLLLGSGLGIGLALSAVEFNDDGRGSYSLRPAAIGAALGMALGSTLGYALSSVDPTPTQARGVRWNGGVAPTAHGMVASLGGQF